MPELCCCEYYDNEGERNHILACCCNCSELDEYCERVTTCQSVPGELKRGLLQTCQDRMRLPFYGGAIKVTTVLPSICVGLLIITASLSFISTVVSAIIAVCILGIALRKTSVLPKFFALWMGTSVVATTSIFEFITVPYLYILPEEHMLAIAFTVSSVLCIIKMHYEAKELQYRLTSEKSLHHCAICQIHMDADTVHKYWLNTCVIASMHKYYLIATGLGSASLLYTANLTLTTVCHPFRLLTGYSLLLPDDCGEVYGSFGTALPFVSGVYSAAIGSLLFFELIVNLLSCVRCGALVRLLRFLCVCLRRTTAREASNVQ